MFRNILNRTVNGVRIFRQFSNQFIEENRFNTPEEGYYWKSGYENILLPDNSLDGYIWQNMSKWQNHIAIECGVTGRKYTYSKLRDHSAAFAIKLQKKFHLKHGDVIGICLQNIPEFAIAMLGAIEAGLIVTTINPIYTADEIARQINFSNCKLIIGSANGYPELKEACEIANRKMDIVTVRSEANQRILPGAIDFYELIATENIDFSELKNNFRSSNDICLLPFSSGTTGLPKGVMLTHSNITSNCNMFKAKLPISELISSTTNNFQDVLPSVLPFFHIYGLTASLLNNLSLGCKIITLPTFKPDGFITCLTEHKATFLILVPPLILFLGNSEKVTRKHLNHVRTIMSGAAPIGEPDVTRMKKKATNVEFLQAYGLTETSPIALLSHLNSTNYTTIGWPSSNTEAKIIKIDDSKCKGLDVDDVGELLVRGPHIMKGYLNNKTATDETIVCNGWLRTGDIASYDKDGFFYIKDRLKELIKVKGFQVAPAELEEILRDHPKVSDAAVIGIPHPTSGEVPRAFIVQKQGVTATEKELQDYVAKKVARYKRLEGGVQFIETMPRTTTGKILRRQLKQFI